LSIIIRDPVEKLNRSGINCIKYEQNSPPSSSKNDQTASNRSPNSKASSLDRLFTAGRDSIIRVYTNLYEPNSSSEQAYQMSLSHHTDWVNDIVVCKTSKTGLNCLLKHILGIKHFYRFLRIFLTLLFKITKIRPEFI
jgi:WD repeat-containing protein 48